MKFFRFEFGKKQIIQEYEMSAHNGIGHKRPHTDNLNVLQKDITNPEAQVSVEPTLSQPSRILTR